MRVIRKKKDSERERERERERELKFIQNKMGRRRVKILFKKKKERKEV